MLLAASKQEIAQDALRAMQRTNAQLKESLEEALAHQQEQAGRSQLNTDSAGHLLLRLLDGLLAGETVGTQAALEARNALLRGGDSVWKPLELDWSEVVDGDKEVKAALARLLGTVNESSDLSQTDTSSVLTALTGLSSGVTPKSGVEAQRSTRLSGQNAGAVRQPIKAMAQAPPVPGGATTTGNRGMKVAGAGRRPMWRRVLKVR